jgi:hypothetical protein
MDKSLFTVKTLGKAMAPLSNLSLPEYLKYAAYNQNRDTKNILIVTSALIYFYPFIVLILLN